jgi:hypothetical protein
MVRASNDCDHRRLWQLHDGGDLFSRVDTYGADLRAVLTLPPTEDVGQAGILLVAPAWTPAALSVYRHDVRSLKGFIARALTCGYRTEAGHF